MERAIRTTLRQKRIFENSAGEYTAENFTTPKRILLVEDIPALQRLHSGYLKEMGYEVEVASNGLLAIHLYKTQPTFDAVVLDIGLPDMTGIEVCKIIRAQFNDRQIPILALTAFTQPAIKTTCLEVGMNRVVHKPIGCSELRAALLELMH